MIDNNLRIFIKVAEKLSFVEAANDLYISQPAVSKAVKNLENELEVKLFIRDKRSGLSLTDIGQAVLSQAYRIADADNHIRQLAYEHNHLIHGKIRIGAVPVLVSCLLARVLPDFKSAYPSIDIELIEGSSAEIRNMTAQNAIDIGFVFSPFDTLEHKILFADHMVAISNKPLSPESVDLSKPDNDLIFCHRSKETTLDNLSPDLHPDFSHCLTVENPESVINLVKYGNGVGIISEFVLSTYANDLYVYPTTPPIQTEVGIVSNSFDNLTPAAARFVDMVCKN